jgi:hypothetical protein
VQALVVVFERATFFKVSVVLEIRSFYRFLCYSYCLFSKNGYMAKGFRKCVPIFRLFDEA